MNHEIDLLRRLRGVKRVFGTKAYLDAIHKAAVAVARIVLREATMNSEAKKARKNRNSRPEKQ